MLKAIIFDFDGTIVDSDGVTLLELQGVAKQFHYPLVTNKQVLANRGFPIIDIFPKLYPDATPVEIEQMYEYKNKMSDSFMKEIPMFEGAHKILKQLKKEGYILTIVTSRRRHGLDILLTQHHLGGLFTMTIAKEDVTNFKPHPEGILKTLIQLQVKSNEVVYVGDAETDVVFAKNANIPCILISKDKEDCGAKYHISNITKLPKLIEEINL